MQATNTKAKHQQPNPSNDWLLRDLTQIHDYCIQEGEYSDADAVEAIIKEAVTAQRTTRQLAGKKG